jgi:hypothetical protein
VRSRMLHLFFGATILDGNASREVSNAMAWRMDFASWSQPLEAYATALEEAGLAITSLGEPLPERGNKQDHRIPLFLWLKARHLAR